MLVKIFTTIAKTWCRRVFLILQRLQIGSPWYGSFKYRIIRFSERVFAGTFHMASCGPQNWVFPDIFLGFVFFKILYFFFFFRQRGQISYSRLLLRISSKYSVQRRSRVIQHYVGWRHEFMGFQRSPSGSKNGHKPNSRRKTNRSNIEGKLCSTSLKIFGERIKVIQIFVQSNLSMELIVKFFKNHEIEHLKTQKRLQNRTRKVKISCREHTNENRCISTRT